MKQIIKIFSVVVSLSLSVTFISNRSRVKAEPVTATLAAATAVVVGGVIISTLIHELGDELARIDREAREQEAYEQTVFNASVQNAINIQEAYFSEISSELPNSSLDSYQISQALFDPQKYLSYSGVSSPSDLSSDDKLVYYALSSAHNKANAFYVDEANQGLKLSSDDYIDMLHASVSEAYEAFSGIPLDFSLGSGAVLGLSFAAQLHVPSKGISFYPALASHFNARNVYRFYLNDFTNYSVEATGQILIPISKVDKKTLYYVFIGTKYFSPVKAITWDFDYEAEAFKSYVQRFNNSYCYAFNGNPASFLSSNSFNYGLYIIPDNLESTGHYYSVSRPYGDRVSNYSCKPISGFPYGAAFEFSTEEEAGAFVEYLSTFTGEDGYVASNDVASDEAITVNPGLTDIEKAIAAKQSELGVTDVDVGFTADGVTVDDTDVADIDISQSLDISDTIEKFETPDSITTKFPFSLPFDIYHVFNILSAEPKTPHFNIPLDFSSVGGQVYDIEVDLSDYDFIANIVRWLLYGAFLVGLIILTNKLIGRG